MHIRYCKLKNSNIIFEIKKIDKGVAYLKKNNLNLTINTSDIELMPDDFAITNTTSVCTITKNNEEMSNELMIRHMTKIEAEEELDRFIYKAVAHHMPQVRIIHGRHGNVLRDAVHEYLDKNEFVQNYQYADYSKGGIGVTVANIGKRKN